MICPLPGLTSSKESYPSYRFPDMIRHEETAKSHTGVDGSLSMARRKERYSPPECSPYLIFCYTTQSSLDSCHNCIRIVICHANGPSRFTAYGLFPLRRHSLITARVGRLGVHSGGLFVHPVLFRGGRRAHPDMNTCMRTQAENGRFCLAS